MHHVMDPTEGTAWADLDDACVQQVFSKLDARTLVACQQINRRSRQIARHDLVWQAPYCSDFPQHYGALRKREGLPWNLLYRQRLTRDSNWQHGKCRTPVESLRGHSGPIFATRFLGPPFPSNLAVSGGVYGQNEAAEIMLWDLDWPRECTGRMGWQLVDHSMGNLCGVFDLQHIPGSSQIICCGFGSEVNVCSMSPKERKREPTGVDEGCSQLSDQVESNLRLATGEGVQQGSGTPAKAGSGYELRHTHTLLGHESACPAAACQRDGLTATASFDGSLRLWRIPAEAAAGGEKEGEEEGLQHEEPVALSAVSVLRDPFSTPDNPIFHSNAVCGVALSSDGTKLCSGGNDMQVKQWDVESGRVSLRLTGHEGWVWHVEALDESHHVLVSGGTDSSVRIWDTRTGRQAQRANICTETLYPVAGLCVRPPDQRYLMAGVFDGCVHVVDRRQMRALYRLQGHSDRVTRVCCNGDTILSGSFDSHVNLWSF